jgi:hypothetical protein
MRYDRASIPPLTEETMGAGGEALAKKFEAKVEEATRAFEALSEADWRKTTAAETWTVGVVAHHVAVSHETLAGLIKTLADGKPGPNIPMDAIHAMNAKHAQDHAACTQAETIALHRKNAAAAAALVRGLDDAALERSGQVIAGMPPMTAGQLAGGLLVGHIADHLSSIRTTVGA